MGIFARLEAHYRDMCDTEFTIEQGKLWMLQTRVGKRTGRAALRMAVDMVDDPAIQLTPCRGARQGRPPSTSRPCCTRSSPTTPHLSSPRDSAASPGAAVGAVCFSADDAAAAAARGETVILVRSETSPEDVHGMLAAEGILTAQGRPREPRRRRRTRLGQAGRRRCRGPAGSAPPTSSSASGDTVVREGDVISIDGSEGTVVARRREADRRRGAAGARQSCSAGPTRSARAAWACAPTRTPGADAANARRLGAEGIGLCRTEHMFFGDDRLPIMRRMILARLRGRGDRRPRGAAGRTEGRLPRRSSRRWTDFP